MVTMNSAMENFSTSKGRRVDYFGKNRFVFKLIGISLDGNEGLPYKMYSFVLLFLNFSFGFLKVWEQFSNNMETELTTIMYPCGAILGFAKTMVYLKNRIKLGKLLERLEKDPFLPNLERGGDVEEKIMGNWVWITNVQNFVYTGFPLGTISGATLFVLARRIIYNDFQYAFGSIPMVNTTYSPNYEVWWCYESFTVILIGVNYAICDLTTGSAFSYAAFQFKMLQNNLRRIVEISHREMIKETGGVQDSSDSSINVSMIPWKYLKKSLVEAINYHLAIIDIANEMEELFNAMLLFVFLDTLVLVGISVNEQSLVATGGTITVIGQLLISCYWGEQLMYESLEVGRAAYEANFVGADLRFQKSLILIIRRSQNPLVITAGKFSVVSLSSFAWFLRTAYSASTVLRQMK